MRLFAYIKGYLSSFKEGVATGRSFHLSCLKMFSLNSLSLVTKIFVITVKGLEPAISCIRDNKTHVIFKLTPMIASVIDLIPCIC